MNTDNSGSQTHPETLDADAVCAQCNTVNAEGTLLCKVCGNNLRDQRMIRLTADQAMDLELSGRRRKTWASGLLFVLAIGVIVATLVNQDRIVAWLVNSEDSNPSEMDVYWSGDYDDYFERLADDLRNKGLTAESAVALLNSGAAAADTQIGTYALFTGDEFVGSASVAQDGDDIFFVALLENGNEVRGRAEPQGNFYASSPETTIRVRSRVMTARGVAMPQGGGVTDCIGDFNNNQVNFIAYHLPEN